ncbi:MAG: response regulator [Gammaproteobacteria bacterium]
MINILIADDHPIMREGLKFTLARETDMRLVAETDNAYEIANLCKQHAVDVVLLDISMPGPGLLETIDRLLAHYEKLKILILSMHPENDLVVRAIQGGASGFVSKNNTAEHLAGAIRRVYHGHVYLSDKLATLMTNALRHHRKDDKERLSKREYEVLQFLATGLSITDIGTKLSLSPKTISTFRARILEKLHLDNNADLVRYVMEKEVHDKNST